MLYVTTRSASNPATPNRALTDSRGPEGGFYVPMRQPSFTQPQIAALAERPFSQNVAEVLNLLFGTQMDGWSVEFAIGRFPVKLISLGGKVTVAQTWHNHTARFNRLVSGLEKAIRQSDQIRETASDWLEIAARISVLFGIFGQMLADGILEKEQKLDFSVPAGDDSLLMAAWYARQWGLPIGNIVCCSGENPVLWNFLHKGELRTENSDAVEHLERLVYAVLGQEEAERFCRCCAGGGVYQLSDEQTLMLRYGLRVPVIGESRVSAAVVHLFQARGFVADLSVALSFCGLTDYRAASGENRPALIISEESPLFSLLPLSECLDISPAKLKQLLQ